MAKKNKQTVKKQINEFLIIAGIILFSILFWDSVFIYPIKFFVVILHETSHAIVTIITGGTVKSIYITSYLGGITKSNGGNSLLIASAGYIGSLIIGALLFISAYNIKVRTITTKVLSIILLLITVGYLKGSLSVFFGLMVSIFFFFLPEYFNKVFASFFLKFIGLISCLYVLTDIKNDLITTSIRETDAQIIEFITGIPSLAVGFLWLVISLLTVYFLIRYSLRIIR